MSTNRKTKTAHKGAVKEKIPLPELMEAMVRSLKRLWFDRPPKYTTHKANTDILIINPDKS
jgi:hypothetical protein